MYTLSSTPTTLSQASLPNLSARMLLLLVLGLSSGLSVAIVVVRAIYTQHYTFLGLVWNLFLAWVPLFCALLLWWLEQPRRSHRILHSPLSLGLLLGWFAFFPNAPYIITDLVHLYQRDNAPFWYDLLLIFSFAWNGLILGFTSLWIVQGVIQSHYGRWAGWLLVGCTLTASSFGIYLGRFLRWNSWDIVTNPHDLTLDILERITNPLAHPKTIAVTILFSGFLLLAYLTIALLAQAHWGQQEQEQIGARV
jgi:uncharacterized membrane protein